MPPLTQPFAAAAQEDVDLDEIEDARAGPERATRRPSPTELARRQVALREEHARSETDGVEVHRCT